MKDRISRIQSNRVALFVYLPRELVRHWRLKPGDYVRLTFSKGEGLIITPIEIKEKHGGGEARCGEATPTPKEPSD